MQKAENKKKTAKKAKMKKLGRRKGFFPRFFRYRVSIMLEICTLTH
jgi:hypothetical protein